MKNYIFEDIAGSQALAEVKISRGIYQGGSFFSLSHVIAMMKIIYVVKKYTGGHISKSQKINHLLYYRKILAKTEKCNGVCDTNNKKYIQPGKKEWHLVLKKVQC